jgi:hypothetical protein
MPERPSGAGRVVMTRNEIRIKSIKAGQRGAKTSQRDRHKPNVIIPQKLRMFFESVQLGS